MLKHLLTRYGRICHTAQIQIIDGIASQLIIFSEQCTHHRTEHIAMAAVRLQKYAFHCWIFVDRKKYLVAFYADTECQETGAQKTAVIDVIEKCAEFIVAIVELQIGSGTAVIHIAPKGKI